jgi:endonuclease/exonuclease/phosphatase family metal-dependent hydrolase
MATEGVEVLLRQFSVATVNLYNLQLPGAAMNPNQEPWTPSEFEAKITWLAAQLTTLDADVVGLQELWHRDAMLAVLQAGGLSDTYDLLAEPATGARIVCAALVRRGLLHGTPRWVDRFPDGVRLESTSGDDPQAPAIAITIPGFSRPVLNFQVELRDDRPATEVFVTHLKSKLPTAIYNEGWYRRDPGLYKPHTTAIGAALSTIRRTAEATGLRVLLTAVMKGSDTPVIVLGDINDGQNSNTVNILTEQPRYLVGESRGGADNGLYTAQTLQEYRDSRDVYYTHVHDDLRESLDHVLVSEQHYDHSLHRVWLFDGLTIYNDHLNDEDHRARGTTDHGLVKVRFRYQPYSA